MNGRWEADELLGALDAAVRTLHAAVDEVNALNVFPVPDGDTGSNMLATLQAAMAEARSANGRPGTVGDIAAAFSFGALMGARGNSGVILSQFFRGLADAFQGRREIDAPALARGLGQACDAAYAAVGKPVEGTILTVARDASRAAQQAAREGAGVDGVLGAATEEAAASVQRTPTLLPILREAGVVDAGGRGLELLLRGALAYVRGDRRPVAPVGDGHFPDFALREEDGFGYETVYIVQPPPEERLVLAAIRDRLEQIGESVAVAGDERAVKVHVHSERPDEVIAYGLSLGTLSNISVENLDAQAREVRYEATHGGLHHQLEDDAGVAAARAAAHMLRITDGAHPAHPGTQVVAVAAGEGFARIFEGLGVGASLLGGQSANPSAGEIAQAIHATGSEAVIVLPNNPNVRLAATQAGTLCPDVRVEVVATRNAAEGVAALLAFDANADPAENTARMLRAARGVQTMHVTQAIRDARIGRRTVHRGEHLVLGADEGLLAADPDRAAAVKAAVGRLAPDFELLTLYRGADVPAAEAEDLARALRDELDGVEVEVVDGGQPHYSFLISVE